MELDIILKAIRQFLEYKDPFLAHKGWGFCGSDAVMCMGLHLFGLTGIKTEIFSD